MKWISLNDRQPKVGQLVALKKAPLPDSRYTQTQVVLCTWGTSSDWRYPPETGATHWWPIPPVDDRADSGRDHAIWQSWPPEVKGKAAEIVAEMAKRAPRIEWRAEPTSMIRDVGIGEPGTASMKDPGLVTNFYAHGWRITGQFDTGLDVFTFSREITDDYFRTSSVDILGYIVDDMAHALAHTLLKGDHEPTQP